MNKGTSIEKEGKLQTVRSALVKASPYLLYFVIIVFYHVCGYELNSDDRYVTTLLKPTLREELPGLVSRSCEGWSSRVLINPLIWILLHLDIRVWGILDIGILMLGFYCVMKLCSCDTGNWIDRMLVFGVVMLFPFDNFTEVGWVVTSVTYAWPLVAGMLACFTVKQFLERKKTSWKWLLPVCLVTIFAVNKEELSVTLTIILLYIVYLSVKERRPAGVIYIQTGIALAAICFHLFNSGNQGRSGIFTEELHMTGIDKVIMGFVATLHHLFFYEERNFFFLCMCILIALVTYEMSEKKWIKYVSLVPIVLCAVSMLTGLFTSATDSDTWRDSRLILPVLFGSIGIICILLCMYEIVDDRRQFEIAFVLLLAGFAGRMTVGFSGIGLSSFIRTFTFLYYIILGVVACLLIRCEESARVSVREKLLVNRVVMWLGIISLVRNIFALAIL